MSEANRLVFRASLPANASSFRDLRDGGVRISLDVPESDQVAAAPIILLRGKLLRITIEEADHVDPDPPASRWLSVKERIAPRGPGL